MQRIFYVGIRNAFLVIKYVYMCMCVDMSAAPHQVNVYDSCFRFIYETECIFFLQLYQKPEKMEKATTKLAIDACESLKYKHIYLASEWAWWRWGIAFAASLVDGFCCTAVDSIHSSIYFIIVDRRQSHAFGFLVHSSHTHTYNLQWLKECLRRKNNVFRHARISYSRIEWTKKKNINRCENIILAPVNGQKSIIIIYSAMEKRKKNHILYDGFVSVLLTVSLLTDCFDISMEDITH